MNLTKLKLPESLNYIGVFVTLGCQLKCVYCINIPDSNQQLSERKELFPVSSNGLTTEEWIAALNRIPNREDLPLSFQGGEPTLVVGGLTKIVEGVDHYIDLLTNMVNMKFFKNLKPEHRYKLQRNAPYPSIRVSFHNDEMKRVWGDNAFQELVRRCESLKDYGFNVSPVKAESDVGIYQVAYPDNQLPDKDLWQGKVPFETKEFLGVHEGGLFGTYKYKHSTDLIASGIHDKTLECECRTSELLISPEGFVFGCHHDLYETYANGGLSKELVFLRGLKFHYKKFKSVIMGSRQIKPIGHLLDSEFSMDDLKEFRKCYNYGKCVGCDTKLKNNAKQSLDNMGVAHTSVEIKNVKWPEGILV